MGKCSKTTTDDLRKIHDYIAKDSVVYTKWIAEEIISKPDYLKGYPNIGRTLPELGNPKIRELMIYSYGMVYQVEKEGTISREKADWGFLYGEWSVGQSDFAKVFLY